MSGYVGGTAAADLARLRRMVAEPGTATYTDSLLISAISSYPLPDVAGEWPLLTSGSANTDWAATFDLAMAAADIWEEKATGKADNYNFTADGATFNKLEVTKTYERQARKWRSRRQPGNYEAIAYPGIVVADVWIGNINDPYE